jgi:methyl-accepting chemotaxis protein
LLQIPSTSSRVESSSNSSVVDESEVVHRLRNQIAQLNKYITGIHTMAALVKKKSEIAAAVEQHALDCLRVATDSLSCKNSSTYFFCIT